MSAKWFIGLVMLHILLTIISGICEMTSISAADIGRIQLLMQPDVPAYTNPVGAVFSYMTATWDYIENLWGIFWFDYAFFQGSWLYLRYCLFMPVSVGVIVTLVIAVVRGVGGS